MRMHHHARLKGRSIDWWFHVQVEEPGRLESVYPDCALRVIRSPYPLSEWTRFFSAFWCVCLKHRFDVVHIHSDLTSAPYAAAARLAGVRRVIVHVHNADEAVLTPSVRKQRLYRPALRQVCLTLADAIVGISDHTVDTLLAGRSRRLGRDVVHYYGVEPTPFASVSVDRTAFRRELDLPPDALVLLFAGRMVPEKNPCFAVDVLAELRRLDSRAVAVFAGSGSLAEAVRTHAHTQGVGPWIRMIGWRDDVAEVMSASDLFILPRLERPMEGFGLAVIEAQLAGLRMLLSQGIPDDPLLPGASLRRLPLAAGAFVWAQAAKALLDEKAPLRSEALKALSQSPMNMDHALQQLIALHGQPQSLQKSRTSL
jgi:glycosyltransferase involved in cell wall biosynthesis